MVKPRQKKKRRQASVSFWSQNAKPLIGLAAGVLVAGIVFVVARSSARGEANEKIAAELALLAGEGLSIELTDLDPEPSRSLQDACRSHAPRELSAATQDVLWDESTPISLLSPDRRPQRIELTTKQRKALTRSAKDCEPLLVALLETDGMTQDTATLLVVTNPGGDLDPSDPRPALLLAREALQYRVVLAVEKRAVGKAWKTVERMIAIAGRLEGPGTQWRQVSDAWVQAVFDAITGLLASLPPPAADTSKRIRRGLTKLEDTAGVQLCLRAEFARLLVISRGLLEEDSEGEAFVRRELEPDTAGKLIKVARAFQGRILADRVDLVRLQARLIRASALPAHQSGVEAGAVGEELRALPRTHVVNHLWGGEGVRQLAEHQPVRVARLRLARMALALAAQEELPKSAPRALVDPFSSKGSPLRWRRIGPREGVLWSPGSDADLELDRGEFTPEGEAPPFHWVRLELRLPQGS
ncbi:MAG: hypothetical protein JKY65_20815 [Planctomycetes bacterium]|nr:hypothetical protein [Planctomycetota bacterium]